MRSLAMLFAVFIAFVGLPGPANAQTQALEVHVTVLGHTGEVAGSPSDHFVTFSDPVALPGVSLGPGAYIFRLITPSVMQVVKGDRSMVYAMFFVNNSLLRSEVKDEYAVTLKRIRDDAPPRITALFPAGAWTGYEFLTYPKIEIAGERFAIK